MSHEAPCESVRDQSPPAALLARARALLEAGALVVLPTETGHQLAARADRPAALAALRAAAGSGQPLSWLVPGPSVLEGFARLAPLAGRLAARYWPGPLALVLQGVPAGLEQAAEQGWTRLRCPAQPATQALLGACPFPLALAAPPDARAAAALARSGGAALALDGGPPRLDEAESVLRLGPGRFELEHAGLFTLEQLRAAAGLSIGFVCTGNTCRSPMAEALAREALARRLGCEPARSADFGFALCSMGVHAPLGQGASKLALSVMQERGLDLSAHRAAAAVPEQLAALDRAYALARTHLEALGLLLPPGKAGHIELLDPGGEQIPDPIGGTRQDYRRTADAIARAVEARLGEWA